MVTAEPLSEEMPVVLGFEGFHRTNRDRLYRALVMTVRDADVAAEAVDEAMARAAERWETVGAYDAPEGWVYRVALNWARSVFRRRRPLPRSSGLVWDALPDPDVTRAVAALSYKLRVVVVARYYLDWST
ncbi:MAG: RNA polymerase sigma factor, partial [Actinomycetota bacterium]